MATSKHTFDQVKSILGKLDRSIDAARARRMDTPPASTTPGTPTTPSDAAGRPVAPFGPGGAFIPGKTG